MLLSSPLHRSPGLRALASTRSMTCKRCYGKSELVSPVRSWLCLAFIMQAGVISRVHCVLADVRRTERTGGRCATGRPDDVFTHLRPSHDGADKKVWMPCNFLFWFSYLFTLKRCRILLKHNPWFLLKLRHNNVFFNPLTRNFLLTYRTEKQ